MEGKDQEPTTNPSPKITEWDKLINLKDQPNLDSDSIQILRGVQNAQQRYFEKHPVLAPIFRDIYSSKQKLEALDAFDKNEEQGQNNEQVSQIDVKIANINDKLNALNDTDSEAADQIKNQAASINEKLGVLDDLEPPLVAINADFAYDKKELAGDYAERELKAEIYSKKGIKRLINRIWKGNLFKKYYQKKYEREIYADKRKIDQDGEKITLGNIIESRSGSAMKRFVMGATDEYSDMIHTEVGESLTEADARTTEIVKAAIEKYATAKVPEGTSLEDLKVDFSNDIARLKAEGRDNGEPLNESMIDNYFEVAVQARQRAEHGIAMEKVMEGFKVYNAEVRNNIRTKAHRDNLDKITNFLESSKIGKFIPPEVLTVAVGAAYGLAQTSIKTVTRAAGLGIGASIFAGFRERNRVTEDRARMLRDIASGNSRSNTNGEEAKSRIAKKRSKYEARIGGTLYDLRPASELTKALEDSVKTDDLELRRRIIAEARVRVDLSDSENKDLISYSSEDKIGDERLALDIALIRAEKSLPENDLNMKLMKEAIQNEATKVTQKIEQKDKVFKTDRAKLARKASAKTLALGTAVFFGSHELMAAIDPDKASIFEEAGLFGSKKGENAKDAIRDGLTGDHTNRTKTITGISSEDKAAIAKYKEAGFKQTGTVSGWSETKTDLVEIDPANSDHKVRAIYDGWADNGTYAADGNELNTFLENGSFHSNVSGISSFNGQTLDINSLAAAGKVKGYLTIGGAKFEIQGKMSGNGLIWGENGVFTTTTGETIKAIGDNGEKLYKYFEVAVDNGVDGDGYTHLTTLATDVGSDTFSGKIQEVTETIVEHPATYTFTRSY